MNSHRLSFNLTNSRRFSSTRKNRHYRLESGVYPLVAIPISQGPEFPTCTRESGFVCRLRRTERYAERSVPRRTRTFATRTIKCTLDTTISLNPIYRSNLWRVGARARRAGERSIKNPLRSLTDPLSRASLACVHDGDL